MIDKTPSDLLAVNALKIKGVGRMERKTNKLWVLMS